MADINVERRRYPRIKSRLPLEYKNLREVAKGSRNVLTKDISEGGVRFASSEFLSLANRLVITVVIPTTARQIKAITKIVWIKKLPFEEQYEMGSQFLEMSKEDKEEISKYVKTIADLNIPL